MRQTTVQDLCFAPIYTFIYFGGGLRDVRTDKVARIGQKTASGAKVTTFTLKWGVLAKKPPSDQNASKNHVYVGLSTFSFLDPPPGYRLDSLNLEGISLTPHQFFRILGQNFQVFFTVKYHFSTTLPPKWLY